MTLAVHLQTALLAQFPIIIAAILNPSIVRISLDLVLHVPQAILSRGLYVILVQLSYAPLMTPLEIAVSAM